MNGPTSPIATTKPKRWPVILIAPWASNAPPTRNKPMGPPKRKKNTSGAMAPAWPRRPPQAMAMSCWLNIPSPESENDVTYFEPLYQQSVLALHQFPTHLTADAAFDAWYVYQQGALHHGIAAVPKNQHGHPIFQRDADGPPICPKGLRMSPVFTFQHTRGY